MTDAEPPAPSPVQSPAAPAAPAEVAPAWPAALLDALRADRRVIGAADVSATDGRARSLVVVTTWDGREPVAADLPRLGALALGGAASVERSDVRADRPSWTGISADGRRVELWVVRIGDLKPSAGGEKARVVLDSKGLLDQWVRWSAGRDRTRDAPPADDRARLLLAIDDEVRALESLPPGAMRVRDAAAAPEPVRPRIAESLRHLRDRLAAGVPAEAALAQRIDTALLACPLAGAGIRVVPGRLDPAAAFESFLRVADGEGFLGDRVLLGEAVRRLADHAKRPPVFDEGFVLSTFDAVEARWRLGEAIGGCKTPLVPGVHVGIGVTPADHLEFWAAPFVREEHCSVACVADAGVRVVRERTAGKDAFFAALLGEVDRAWDELPGFLRTARRAGRTPAGDADEAMKPLHLPRSYREAAKALAGRAAMPSRLSLALALARAGHDQEPLHARKLGLAAGRLLALTPPGADADDDACDGPGCDSPSD